MNLAPSPVSSEAARDINEFVYGLPVNTRPGWRTRLSGMWTEAWQKGYAAGQADGWRDATDQYSEDHTEFPDRGIEFPSVVLDGHVIPAARTPENAT